ncbi:L-amino acid amidase [Fulvia fulva]|nr:L-amino acid amidase [Fulvia fulva]WPV14346.1 L-amino acid amidase [Fulvia fulva]WPV28365.1 L-amino acid amidase [Fulvia fulva]
MLLDWGDLPFNKTPLICLHGGPGIGCAESTHFRDKKGDHEFWTPQLFMAELDDLKTHVGIGAFDLLGQSWGGMLAGQYAIEKQPKGLRELIIADSPENELPKELRETLERCERDDKTDTPEYEEAVMYFYRLHICRLEPWLKELEDSFAELEEDNTVYYTMNGPSEFYVIGNLKDWNIAEGLKKITEKTAPGGVLVVNGYYDEAQDETTETYWKHPSARTKWIRYPLSSHMPMLEETERFLADLGRFLKSE